MPDRGVLALCRSMSTFVLVLLVAAIALGILGIHRKSGARAVARLVLGLLFTLCAGATLALLVGSVVLSSRGGGVLFLFALPAAVISWVTGSMFFASWKSERYYDLGVDGKIRQNIASLDQSVADLRASIAAKTAERERFWISARRREQLAHEIEREREQLERLPLLRAGLARPEAYEQDEP